jgi:hypothetical protein
VLDKWVKGLADFWAAASFLPSFLGRQNKYALTSVMIHIIL